MTKTAVKHTPPEHTPRRRSSAARTGLVIGVVVTVMVLVGVIALVANHGSSGKDATSYTPTAKTSGDGVVMGGTNLPKFSGSGTDPAVGTTAPELRGRDFEGAPVTIANDGRPKVIMFLAHWCPHCQNEVKSLGPWLRAGNAPQGVDLYSVVTSTNPDLPNYPPQRWLESERWPLPTMVDPDNRAATAYGLSAFPFWTLVDGHGKVVLRFSGEASTDQVSQLLSQLAGT